MYSIEKSKGFNVLGNFDYILFTSVSILSIIGLFIVRSATLEMSKGDKMFYVQLGSWFVGLILAMLISKMDYNDLKNLGIVLYVFCMLLLILVLFIGYGETLNSRSWFNVPMIGSFQPSELAKIAFVIMTAIYFEKIKDGHKRKYNSMLKLVVFSIIPIILILRQPDVGTVAVFIISFLVMLFICGLPYKYILITIFLMIPMSIYIWFFKLAKYQKSRILVLFHPEDDLQGKGYNVYKSKIAVGSGQLTGKGLFKGIQTQNSGVPVKESDFIFSVIGEELGFIGAVIILLLIFFILMRCIYIAKNAKDSFGSFIVIGFTSILAFHYIENVSMNIGLLPVTGIPMPFVSQGGSALITNYISIGIILSVSMRKSRSIFKT
ncbi:MAG: rod shape-determining protein RodA [Clostridiales bacterium]